MGDFIRKQWMVARGSLAATDNFHVFAAFSDQDFDFDLNY